MAVETASRVVEMLPLFVQPRYDQKSLTHYGFQARLDKGFKHISQEQNPALQVVAQDVSTWFRGEQHWQPEGIYATPTENPDPSIDLIFRTRTGVPLIKGGRPWNKRVYLDLPALLDENSFCGAAQFEETTGDVPEVKGIKLPLRQVGSIPLEEIAIEGNSRLYVKTLTLYAVYFYDSNFCRTEEEDIERVRVTIRLGDIVNDASNLFENRMSETDDLRTQKQALEDRIAILDGFGPESRAYAMNRHKSLEGRKRPF